MVGFTIVLVCLTQVAGFVMGYGGRFAAILAGLFAIYGIYIFIYSFRASAYDMDYEFGEDEFTVKSVYGAKNYSYDEVTGLDQIIPENEMLYSIIHLNVGKKSFIIPFSYKKEVADQIFTFLNERITTKTLEKDVQASTGTSEKEESKEIEVENEIEKEAEE